jgi:hypothetical protein
MKTLAAFTAGAAVLFGAQTANGIPMMPQEEKPPATVDPHTVKVEQQNLTLQTRLVRARALLRKARRKASRRAVELHAALEASPEGYARAVLRVCIHPKEADWQDSGAPFWGGLQMDTGFQRTYGAPLLQALGTADHWPIAAQLAVAEVAYYAGRGFGPWPNTRRGCG